MTSSSWYHVRIAAILVAAAASAWTAALRAEWIVDIGAAGRYDSNLTRAQDAADRRPDRALTFAASVARHESLSGYDGIRFGIDLRAELHDRYRGLDFIGIGASASYRRKFALGLTAPYGVLTASVSHDDYRVDVRDGNRLDLGVELGRRHSESLDIGAGLAYDRRHATTSVAILPGVSGAIFDLRGGSAFARADYALDERWMLGGRVAVRRGDVESTSQRSRPVFLASDAIADDPAFRDPLLFGYRLRGTTVSLGGTLGYALGDHCAIHVAYVDEVTNAARDLRYRSHTVNVAFDYRF